MEGVKVVVELAFMVEVVLECLSRVQMAKGQAKRTLASKRSAWKNTAPRFSHQRVAKKLNLRIRLLLLSKALQSWSRL